MALIGTKVDLTYEFDHLGSKADAIQKLIDGSHPFSKTLRAAKRPMIIVGSSALQSGAGAGGAASDVLNSVRQLVATLRPKVGPDWKIINVLHRVASQVAALDVGYRPGVEAIREKKPKLLYMLGADEGVVTKEMLDPDCFVIYQGRGQ